MTKKVKKTIYIIAAVFVGLIILVWILGGTVGFLTKKAPEKFYASGEPAFCNREEYEGWDREELKSLDDAFGEMGFDLRHIDISGFSLYGYEDKIKELSFDTDTVWPSDLPADFDPDKIMELGKNPGLGVRTLHEMGYTGAGVSIAIIDQGLNPDHIEYADNLMGYEYVHAYKGASMHGSAVTSIAVGKTCGVAPDAKVYYIASTFGKITPIGFRYDLHAMSDSIDRVLEINEILPADKKIRVISISMGFENMSGGEKVKKAIERANDAGIFVITTSTEPNYGFRLMGLGREALDDPDDMQSYIPGSWWADGFYGGSDWYDPEKMLLVPMDSRTYGSFSTTDGYEYCSTGGLSWSVPYLAGVYALCVQVRPDITPQEFIEKAFETGTKRTILHDGRNYVLGTIIDPVKLVLSLS